MPKLNIKIYKEKGIMIEFISYGLNIGLGCWIMYYNCRYNKVNNYELDDTWILLTKKDENTLTQEIID